MSLSERYPDRFSPPITQSPEAYHIYAELCQRTTDLVNIWRNSLKEPLGPANLLDLLQVNHEYSTRYLAFSSLAYRDCRSRAANTNLNSPSSWAPRYMEYIQGLTEMRTISINQIFHPTTRFWHRWSKQHHTLRLSPHIKYAPENAYGRWDRYFIEAAQALDQSHPGQTTEAEAVSQATAKILEEQLGLEYHILETANKNLFSAPSE